MKNTKNTWSRQNGTHAENGGCAAQIGVASSAMRATSHCIVTTEHMAESTTKTRTMSLYCVKPATIGTIKNQKKKTQQKKTQY